MKKAIGLIFSVCILVIISNKAFANRIIYDIDQMSMNTYKLSVKWSDEDAGNIQITAFDKIDDNTVAVYYRAYSEFNVRNTTIDVSILNMNLQSTRTPIIVLKNHEGKTNSVTDLPNDPEMAVAVQNLFSRGIINGYTDGTFKPENSISREEFAAVFVRFMKYDLNYNIESKFTDLPNERWSRAQIMTLVDKGIVNGHGDGTYGMNSNITLGEMAAIISRAKNLQTIPTTDLYKHLQTQHWSNESITNAINAGYIKTSDKFYTDYDQNKPLTRGEVALILNRD